MRTSIILLMGVILVVINSQGANAEPSYPPVVPPPVFVPQVKPIATPHTTIQIHINTAASSSGSAATARGVESEFSDHSTYYPRHPIGSKPLVDLTDGQLRQIQAAFKRVLGNREKAVIGQTIVVVDRNIVPGVTSYSVVDNNKLIGVNATDHYCYGVRRVNGIFTDYAPTVPQIIQWLGRLPQAKTK